ncbi:hypothetical protein FAZ15_16150 [Sphingobacterium olei]|uniref:Uncharacterized protein n=1 Tax=Sphingobacterium olei TaxID=2571155 RepID=A0A4U0NH88_9SPHI|nr:hypothetical protein [Sphingobacterium olei]TJZ53571.1 hypothetical protein FAZ15_16150 [Sphingobacterium olei]
MKTILTSTSTLLFLMLLGQIAIGQSAVYTSRENVSMKLTESLSISRDKANQFVLILENYSRGIEDVRRDILLSPSQRREKTVSLLKEQHASIRHLLSEREYIRWQELGRRRREVSSANIGATNTGTDFQ